MRAFRHPAARLAAALLPLAVLVAGCGGAGDADDEDETPASAPPRVATRGAETVVALDAETLARGAVAVEPLQAVSRRAEADAFGSVLDLADLADARGAWTAAAERIAKDRAALAASRAEFERMTTLHAQERIVSDKDLDAATAAYRADEAELRAAEGALEALRAVARQRWGEVVAGWVERGSPRLDALLGHRERLVQLTLPPGSAIASPPATATLRVTRGVNVEAQLVSPAPATDARVQGESFFYTAPAVPALPPGATVGGALPVGEPASGAVVPASAVVWWQGRAWVYLEEGAGRFARREVATDAPVPGGWFVTSGVAAGDRVVVRGAQLLLSEEGRAAVHGSEG